MILRTVWARIFYVPEDKVNWCAMYPALLGDEELFSGKLEVPIFIKLFDISSQPMILLLQSEEV